MLTPEATATHVAVDTLLRGTTLSDAEVDIVERDLALAPDALERRLLLLGHYFRTRPGSQDHLAQAIWLVDHVPQLDLIAWMSFNSPEADTLAELWREKLRGGAALSVLLNAAFWLQEKHCTEAEALVTNVVKPHANEPVFWERVAEFYIRQLRHLPEQRPRLLRTALAAAMRALNMAGTDMDDPFGAVGLAAMLQLEVGEFEASLNLGQNLLAVSKERLASWQWANVQHVGNTIVGLVYARRDHNLKLASSHLLASVNISGSPQLSAGAVCFGLASELVRQGDIGNPISFLRDVRRLWTAGAAKLDLACAALQVGDRAPLDALAADSNMLST